MPKRKVVYVSPSDKGKWSVKTQGAQRALKNCATKNDAVGFGQQLAKKAGLGQLKIPEGIHLRERSVPSGGIKELNGKKPVD